MAAALASETGTPTLSGVGNRHLLIIKNASTVCAHLSVADFYCLLLWTATMFRHLFHRRSSTLQYRVLTSDDRTSDDEADPLPELHADCVTREEIGQEDLTNLRRVPDSLPASAWLITLMEMCERFAFFGLSGPLQNYIQNSKDDPLRPGALGYPARACNAESEAKT